jgi:hypothetical protein
METSVELSWCAKARRDTGRAVGSTMSMVDLYSTPRERSPTTPVGHAYPGSRAATTKL